MLTSTDHLIDVGWDGTLYPSQTYYSGAGSTGTALLDAGGPVASPIYGKTVVYLGTPNVLAVPDVTPGAVAAPASTLVAATIDTPDCQSAGGRTVDGWKLRTTTTAKVGLPSLTGPGAFATPLSLS